MSKASVRREEIGRMASSGGLASVEELSRAFRVTPSTIRRDLAHLTEVGMLARTYGGAIALPSHPEASLSERRSESHQAKRAIGLWAASQVQSGQSVLLDAGTTTAELAHALRETSPLRVATIGLTPLEAISGAPGVEVICLGGHLRDISQGFEGPITEMALEQLSFDSVFLGCDGLTAERGICEASIAQTRLKELMVRAAETTYVLAHGAKLGTAPFNAWVRMPASWTLVTDESATSAQVAAFTRRGVRVVVVDAAGQTLDV
ncbi:DeoR/GlpR family DNA-binding transcription regulator [Microbacterium sp. NPDC091313]